MVRALTLPAKGNRIKWDTVVAGFGARVTAAGAVAFIFNYRHHRRERRITIGNPPEWTVATARERAKELRRQVDVGADPLAVREAERATPTLREIAEAYDRDHISRLRPSTQRHYRSILRLYILPAFGTRLITDVSHADVGRLHSRLAVDRPYIANRMLATLSGLFAVAMARRLRTDNPVKGIRHAREEPRERYLAGPELARVLAALDADPSPYADAIRLLLLTGARKGEVLNAAWSQFDLATAVWSKPASATKQGKPHRVPLSPEAVTLLRTMRERATSLMLFPRPPSASWRACGVETALDRTWHRIARVAGLQGVRVHDLRHSYASLLVSSGLSLPVIGALLGHSRASTTQRYAHLHDQALRDATAIVGKVIGGGGG
jgi:integrase